MRTSLNPLMYNIPSFSKLFETAGTYELLLSPGTYFFAERSGGGAGGGRGVSYEDYTPGDGGAGGTGQLVQGHIVIKQSVRATVYVGAGGLTRANGGNGGNGGDSTDAGTAGGGGGGGMPTYIDIPVLEIQLDLYAWRNPNPFGGVVTHRDILWTQSPTPRVGDTVYGCNDLASAGSLEFLGYVRGTVSAVSESAITFNGNDFVRMGGWDGNGFVHFDGILRKSNPGGGGGGGGSVGRTGRYSDGGSGGGGGGYYQVSNAGVVSVPGKKGGTGGRAYS